MVPISLLMLLQSFVTANGAILLDENFTALDPVLWEKDVIGSSAHIQLVPSGHLPEEDIISPNMLYSNLSHCESELCFRSELKTAVAYRHNLFDNTGKYWIAFSCVLTEDTVLFPATSSTREVVYVMQLHGGDNENRSPIASIRIEGDQLVLAYCGRNLLEDRIYCEYNNIGDAVTYPTWLDIVLEIDLDTGTSNGAIKAWRNQVLMLSTTGVAIGYNDDINPPYVKFGVYNIAWKSGVRFSNASFYGLYFSQFRVGDENVTYEEMVTGNNVSCGDACRSDDDTSLDPSVVKTFVELMEKSWFAALIPVIIVLVCVILFYIANVVSRRHKEETADELFARMKADNCFTTDSDISKNANRKTEYVSNLNDLKERRERSSSVAESVANALRKTFVWDDEEDYVENSKFTYEEPWVASLKRKTFWYIFGYSSVFLMFCFAVVLYGNPITQEDGLLPWKSIRSWTFWQVGAYLTVTFTMTSIFFVPLYFMPHDFEAGRKWKNDPKFLRRIGVVIPCHKSALEIGGVLRQVIKYIPPQNICVCDNGNYDWPADNTYEVVKEVHPRIQYCFIAQGHKTRALWTGAHRLPKRCKYLMHLDDDTLISDNMVFDESLFKTDDGDHVSAVAFLRRSFRKNRVTNFVDFWYKITDHFHATQATLASRSFVPGPAGLWRRDRFVEIFGIHPALPFGEDIFGGFTTLNEGYAIRAENRCCVTTFSPEVLVNCASIGRTQGYGAASIWKQRAHRWTVSALRITGKSLYSFFTYDTRLGFFSNILFRLYRFREYKIIFVQVLYVPFCIVILSRGFIIEFFLLKFLLFIFPLARNLFLNYICWRGQPEMQVSFETVLLSPFYNFFLIMCAVHGRLKCLLWYLPNVPPNHGMLQRCRPHPLRTIKLLEPEPEEGLSFSNTNPMANVVVMQVGRRDSVSLPEGLFEFFYRDGSSCFVKYSSGGLSATHIKMAEETRATLVYEEVTKKDSIAYQEALDCVAGVPGMDSDDSDDEGEKNTSTESMANIENREEGSSLLSRSTKRSAKSMDSKRNSSLNRFKSTTRTTGVHRDEENLVVTNEDVVRL